MIEIDPSFSDSSGSDDESEESDHEVSKVKKKPVKKTKGNVYETVYGRAHSKTRKTTERDLDNFGKRCGSEQDEKEYGGDEFGVSGDENDDDNDDNSDVDGDDNDDDDNDQSRKMCSTR